MPVGRWIAVVASLYYYYYTARFVCDNSGGHTADFIIIILTRASRLCIYIRTRINPTSNEQDEQSMAFLQTQTPSHLISIYYTIT